MRLNSVSIINVFAKYENTTVENSIILGTMVNGYLCNNAFSSDNLGEPKFDNAKDLGAGAFGALFATFADNIYKWAGKMTFGSWLEKVMF